MNEMTTPNVTVKPNTPARELKASAPKEETVQTRDRVTASIVTARRV
jgi:hypothetical protein